MKIKINGTYYELPVGSRIMTNGISWFVFLKNRRKKKDVLIRLDMGHKDIGRIDLSKLDMVKEGVEVSFWNLSEYSQENEIL